MFLKNHIKKIIFLSVISVFFVIFALSNTSLVTIKLFHIEETFQLWTLVLYSVLLGAITTVLFLISPIITLKSKYKELREKFEKLSDTKLSEIKEIKTDIIE